MDINLETFIQQISNILDKINTNNFLKDVKEIKEINLINSVKQ